jgi:hypothetical protein
MAQPRSPWPALLLLGVIAALIFGATSLGWQGRTPAVGSTAAVGRPGVCVTRQGLCQAPPARAGDPCSCPHLLRGMVPGHVELLGDTPTLPGSRDWSGREPPDEASDRSGLAGP